MPSRIRIPSRALGLTALALTLVTGAVVARADTRGDLNEAKRRLEQLKETMEAREAAVAALQAQLNDLAAKIEIADSEVVQTRKEMDDIRARVEVAEQESFDLRERLNQRAAEAFMSGTATNLEFLLGAGSIADLSDRVAFVDALQQRDVDLGNAVQNKLNELATVRAQLKRMLARQRATLDALARDRATLEEKFAEQQSMVEEARAAREEAASLVAELGDELEQELAPPPHSGGDGIPGPLNACPVDGPHAYADTFGQVHVHPGWTHIHQGNDISAPYGTPIVAPFGGTAVASSDDTAGIYVTVTGAEGYVQMLHMSSLGNVGAVRTGDVVGYVGTTGNASSPHTHFEWHPGGGAAADPYPQLNEVC